MTISANMWSFFSNYLRFKVRMLQFVEPCYAAPHSILLPRASCSPWAYCSLSACYSPGHEASPGHLWACCSPVYDAAPLPRHNAPPGHYAPPGYDAPPGHDAFPPSMLLSCACRLYHGHVVQANNRNLISPPMDIISSQRGFSYRRCLYIWPLISSHYFKNIF